MADCVVAASLMALQIEMSITSETVLFLVGDAVHTYTHHFVSHGSAGQG